MTAEEYITQHWIPNKTWTHLEWPKHQDRLRKCAELCVGNRFVDIGCACGHSTEIMSRFKKGEWHGVDLSKTAVETAARLFPGMQFHGSLDSVGVFDSVVCSEVIEHVEDDKGFVDKLINITEQRLILTTPSIKVDDPGHLRVYTPERIRTLLSDYTYTVVDEDRFYYIIVEVHNERT